MKFPPLERFDLRIKFKGQHSYSFHQLSEVISSIADVYPEPIQLNLPPLQPMNLDFAIRPMQFLSADKSQILFLFSDSIQFRSIKYTNWEDEKSRYLEILQKIIKILEISNVESVLIEYVDKFLFPKIDFDLENWFNFSPKIPREWNINFTDLHLGISFEMNQNEKLIMRLKGREPENEQYKLVLETVYTKIIEIDISENLINLETNLDEGHKLINEKFKEVLTEDMKSKLEVMEE